MSPPCANPNHEIILWELVPDYFKEGDHILVDAIRKRYAYLRVKREPQADDIILVLGDVCAIDGLPIFPCLCQVYVSLRFQRNKGDVIRYMYPIYYDAVCNGKVIVLVIEHYGRQTGKFLADRVF